MLKRDEYKFDAEIAAIIDNSDNGIRLSKDEPDPVFYFLQQTSTLKDLEYVLQHELSTGYATDERLIGKDSVLDALKTYAQQKIAVLKQQRDNEQSWLGRQFSAFGRYMESVLNPAFLKIYKFDGYEDSTNKVMTALCGEQRFSGKSDTNIPEADFPAFPANVSSKKRYSRFKLYLASFLGLPSRPSGLNPNENYQFDFAQFWRDLIGGWNPKNQITKAKGYIIHPVYGDGDCGFTAIGTTRKEAIALLVNEENLSRVKAILKLLLWEINLEEDKRIQFYSFLYNNQILPKECTFEFFSQNFENIIDQTNVLKAYIYYDLQFKELGAGFAHPLILQALAYLQNSDLHIWTLGDDDKLIPNEQYAHYHHPRSKTRKDILFVNLIHFEKIEFFGYPEKGPEDDDQHIKPINFWSFKKVLQILLILPKLFVILPLKIVLFPLKLMVNIAKLVTEFVPYILSLMLTDAINWAKKRREDNVTLSQRKYIWLGILIGFCTVFSEVFNLWFLLGRALTSPLQSAKSAYFFFSENEHLRIRIFGARFENTFSKVLGIFFMLVSVAVSVALWTLLLPFALQSLAPYATTVLQTASATFPSVTKALTALSQVPAVSTTIQTLGSAFTTAGTYLSSTFALSTTFSFLSTTLSVQVSAAFLAAGLALGTVMVPALMLFSWVSNKFSDFWAYWGSSDEESLYLMNQINEAEEDLNEDDPEYPTGSPDVKKLLKDKEDLENQAFRASNVEYQQGGPYTWGHFDEELSELANSLSETSLKREKK